MRSCKSETNNLSSVGAFFGKFNLDGATADFPDRRGIRSKVVVIDYQSSGPKSYATNKIVNFDYDQELNDANILAIELLSTAQLLLVPTEPTKDSPQSALIRGVLILKDNCNNIVMKTPLTNLCKALNGNKTTFVNLKNIDWGSGGPVFNSAAGITSANALAFRVYFQ